MSYISVKTEWSHLQRRIHDFYSAAALLAVQSNVLATAILSVRPSVRHTLVLYPENEVRIMRSVLWGSKNNLVFWYQKCYGGCPLPPKIWAQIDSPPSENRRLQPISAYNVSIARASEKRSIIANRKSTTCFPTSYRRSAYSPKSPEGAQKVNLSFLWTKNRINSATKFPCVTTFSREVIAEPFPYRTVYVYWR